MKLAIYRTGLKFDQVYFLFLMVVIATIPTLGISRNVDPLHDAFFFAQAHAINEGLAINKDIFTAYGPLIPLLLSLTLKIFGDYIIVTRVLGYFTSLISTIIFYKILKRKLDRNLSLTLAALPIVLTSGNMEINSPRWIYTGGIWPTSLALLLSILGWNYLLKNENRDTEFSSGKVTRVWESFATGAAVALLPYCRIQGLVTYATLIGILIWQSFAYRKEASKDYSNQGNLVFFLGSLMTHAIIISYIFLRSSLSESATQLVFAPFGVAGNQGSTYWFSWMKALAISVILSTFLGVSLLIVCKRITKMSAMTRVFCFALLILLIAYLFVLGNFYMYPGSIKLRLDLWFLKSVAGFTSWYWWVAFEFAFIAIILTLVLNRRNNIAKRSYTQRSFRINTLVFLSLLPHLFWNFGYVALLFPFSIIILISTPMKDLLGKFGRPALIVVLNIGIIIGLVTSLIGFIQPSTNYHSKFLRGMSYTKNYGATLDKEIAFLEKYVSSGSTSFLFCDATLYRVINPVSYRVDKDLFLKPPINLSDYLHKISGRTDVVVLCNKDKEMNTLSADEESKFKIIADSELQFRTRIQVVRFNKDI